MIRKVCPCGAGFYAHHGNRVYCGRGARSGRRLGQLTATELRITAVLGGSNRFLAMSFVPPYPGSFVNPWPVGTTVGLGPPIDFNLTVNSATINATAEVEAVIDPNTGQPVNGPPPAGDQYTLVNLTLLYDGPGSASLPDFLMNVWTEGANNTLYKPDSCVPPLYPLSSGGTVYPGQSGSGNLCFTIASTDASVLLLRTLDATPKTGPFPIWFALSANNLG